MTHLSPLTASAARRVDWTDDELASMDWQSLDRLLRQTEMAIRDCSDDETRQRLVDLAARAGRILPGVRSGL